MPNQNTPLAKNYTALDLNNVHEQTVISLRKAKNMLGVINDEVENIFKCLDPAYKESIGERIEYLIWIALDTVMTDIDLNNDAAKSYEIEVDASNE